MNEQSVIEIITDLLRARYYGKYKGIVTEVEVGGRGRIKAKVPGVLHDQTSPWCDPCVPYAGPGLGFAFLPEVGSGVWIEFEEGDINHPIWSGCYWRDGELPAEAAPAKKVLRTKAGHQIVIDDDGRSITITDPSENTVTLDSSGITLKRGGSVVKLDDAKLDVNNSALEVASS
ncbi:MAG: phage baseplate assembly protein V [Minicystis sp.]